MTSSASISLKNRATFTEPQEIWSGAALKETLHEFYELSNLKKLDLVTADYFDFL